MNEPRLYHGKIQFFGIVSAIGLGVEEFIGDVEPDEGGVFHPANEKEGVRFTDEDESFFEEADFAIGKAGLIQPRVELNVLEGIDVVHIEADEVFQRNFLE